MKTYKCYYGSDVDWDFCKNYLRNREMWTDELQELADHVSFSPSMRGTMGYMTTDWAHYNQLKEVCLMASEWHAMQRQENK